MSSAILYVAIVVIWAAVLIPRWLRRDSPLRLPFRASAWRPRDEATVDRPTRSGIARASPRGAASGLSRRRPPQERRPGRDEDRRARTATFTRPGAPPGGVRTAAAADDAVVLSHRVRGAGGREDGGLVGDRAAVRSCCSVTCSCCGRPRKADAERARRRIRSPPAPRRLARRAAPGAGATAPAPPGRGEDHRHPGGPGAGRGGASTTSTPTPSCAPWATNWILALRALARPPPRPGWGVRQSMDVAPS